MKVAIILNGISKRKKFFYREVAPLLTKEFSVTIFETEFPGHAYALAENAAAEFEIVIAAGGDGTLHQVINGVLKSAKTELPVVGVIPFGTGNDFARTCGLIPFHPSKIVSLIRDNDPQSTDVSLISCVSPEGTEMKRYSINACSVGMGPEVVKRLMNDGRRFGPGFTYTKAIVTTFFTHLPQQVTVSSASWEWTGDARTVVVANGRSFGNAIRIAPDAKVDDGILATFIAGRLPLFRFLLYLQQIKSGKKVSDHLIQYNQSTEVTLHSPDSCWIEAEGELVGLLPARVKIINKALRFLR